MTIKVYISEVGTTDREYHWPGFEGGKVLIEKDWLNKIVEFKDFNDLFEQMTSLMGTWQFVFDNHRCNRFGEIEHEDADYVLVYYNYYRE